MKKCLEILLNKVFKKELEIFFGVGSYVEIHFVSYSTNAKSVVVDCKLFTGELELCSESYPEGLHYLLEECWKFTGIHDIPVSATTSLDVI